MSSAIEAAGEAAADGGRQLGRAIRTRRKALGLTLVQVAGQAGLSQPFLSQVERGLARPSMRSLTAIASALGTTGPALMSLPEQDAASFVGHGDVVTVDNTGGGVARSIARGDRAMLPIEFLGGPREFQEYFQHSGEEVLYVVSGRIEVDLDGVLQVLGARDSLYYQATTPHRWRVVDDGPVWVLAVSSR